MVITWFEIFFFHVELYLHNYNTLLSFSRFLVNPRFGTVMLSKTSLWAKWYCLGQWRTAVMLRGYSWGSKAGRWLTKCPVTSVWGSLQLLSWPLFDLTCAGSVFVFNFVMREKVDITKLLPLVVVWPVLYHSINRLVHRHLNQILVNYFQSSEGTALNSIFFLLFINFYTDILQVDSRDRYHSIFVFDCSKDLSPKF